MKGTLKELANLLNITNSKDYETFFNYLTRIHKFKYDKIIKGYVKYKKRLQKQSLHETSQSKETHSQKTKDTYILQNLSKDEIYKIRELIYKNNSAYQNKEKLIQEAIKLIEFLKGICNLDLSMSMIRENILEINQALFIKIIKTFEKENIITLKRVKRYKKGNQYKKIINLSKNINIKADDGQRTKENNREICEL